MASLKDVGRIALALPEVSVRPAWGNTSWRVREKTFVWERPLRPKEVEELGAAAPRGHILGAHVAELATKDALIAAEPSAFFTTSHFEGYPAVLVRLGKIRKAELEELIVEAWIARAPKRVLKAFLDEHPQLRTDA